MVEHVGVGVDLHVQLGQGVLEGELHALVDALRVLHVEPGQAGGHRLCVVAVDLGPRSLGANTPAEVYRLGGLERGNVLHQRVADGGVAAEAGDAVGGVLHAARGRRGGGHVGSVGKETDLVLVVGLGIGAVLVGPVQHGAVLPLGIARAFVGIEDTLVVHEVGDVRLVVLLQVGVVGKHTEAAALAGGLAQTGQVEIAHQTTTGDTALGIGREAHGRLASHGRPAGSGGREVEGVTCTRGERRRHEY